MESCLEVTTHWRGTLLSLVHYKNPKKIKMGGAGFGVPAFDLVRSEQNHLVVQNTSFMKLACNGKAVLEPQLLLRDNDQIRADVGELTVSLRMMPAQKVLSKSFIEHFDFAYALLVLLLFALQLGLIAQFKSMPPIAKEPDLMKTPEVFREVVVRMQKRERVRAAEAQSAGGAAAGPEGLIGQKDKPIKDKAPADRGSKLAKENTPNRSQNAALNMLKKLGLKNAGSVVGNGGLGESANKGLLGLHGSEVGIAGGNGGYGTKGTGSGGGGKALGAGGLGSGSGIGLGGTGDIDLGGKGRGRTRIVPGDVFYEGGLSREEIQRVVERFMSQIKYCYEKEIQSKPTLGGKVTANWIIAPDGRVRTSSLGESTIQDNNVEQCVLKVVNRMVFPEPRGGGIVKVNFPFVFSMAGV